MAVLKHMVFLMLIACNGMLVSSQNYYYINRLPFNTQSKEMAPAIFQNGLVFCSDRRNDVLMSYTDMDRNPLTNLYVSEQKKPGKFENPRLMAKELTTFMFEGPSTFSRDYKTIYFTRTINVSVSLRNRNRPDTTFGIFSAERSSDEWVNLTQFSFNSTDYNTGYPYLSNDGKQLYFCSDAPGGFGGLDLYVSDWENGRWGKPVNLGNQVNTPKNEVFPFITENGRLYFASRGHKQQGDLDIYHTIIIDGAWQKPVPLTEPFNTPGDDYGLVMNASMDTGYFVSDRRGSPDIFAAYSGIPSFSDCPAQKENDFCYVFYEPNNNELDTTAFAYEWDMGDGTIIRALEAEHCFARPDTYTVRLNIVDKLTKEVMVNQASYSFVPERIEQPYIQAPDTVLAGEEISLNGSESYFGEFTIGNYYWDFDDGQRGAGLEIRHRFDYPGTYMIKLGLTGHTGSSAENTQKKCATRKIVVVK